LGGFLSDMNLSGLVGNRWGRNSKEALMTVNVESTSRKFPTRTGEVELLEFFAQRRACDDRDREIVCSDVRALARGIRNALLAVTPLWLALVLWLAR
jgi:hypothetical protein